MQDILVKKIDQSFQLCQFEPMFSCISVPNKKYNFSYNLMCANPHVPLDEKQLQYLHLHLMIIFLISTKNFVSLKEF